ncbi:AraC family transcriptional regulator [Vibrio sp. ZSDE26]|uniref:AraC family transcriptional regulator n=1 Tax=Vibrio amylolyticus TaxID=2847292 RepID=A0A9X2BJH9_9VIBR|nr:AraC family transcriptional regulator [Vibrio amylolyticus]MCK6265849.1 AraC family transcriptional regulator [Vibrio amylolyticus]
MTKNPTNRSNTKRRAHDKNQKAKIRKIALTEKIEDTEKQFIVSRGEKNSSSLVEGHFVSYDCGNGFTIHGGDSHELINSNIISVAPKSMIITILLEGQLEFAYDDLSFDLDTSFDVEQSERHSDSPLSVKEHRAKAVMVNLTKPANFRRHIRKGHNILKLNLVFEPQWIKARLGDKCPFSQFLQVHKNHSQLTIGSEATKLAKQIIKCGLPMTFKQKLEFESLSYSLLSTLLCQFTLCMQSNPIQKPSKKDNAPGKVDSRVEEIIGFIESQLDHPLSLENVALRFSMSVSNLQRKFKQQFGLTVNSYIRYRRLEIAKQHLEQGLVSVTEAAYEAGYQHPANFTHAFKKTFGRPPTTYAKL